jgi:hypothetical protein
MPLSQPAESEVVVWGVTPLLWLVQVTVSPTLTVTVAGEKAKLPPATSIIETAADAAATTGV